MKSRAAEKNQFRYRPGSVRSAKAIILTPEGGETTSERWTEETAATVGILDPMIPEGGVVLDYGAGIGRMVKALGTRRTDLEFVYVDASPQMKNLALAYVGARIARRTKFIRFQGAKALQRAIPPNSIDLVVSIYVLQHVARPLLPALIRSFHRALKPGGRLFLINMHRRAVPALTAIEAGARSRTQQDRVTLEVADDSPGTERAWIDDGADVRAIAVSRFGNETMLPFPPRGFAPNIPKGHFMAYYEKRPIALP